MRKGFEGDAVVRAMKAAKSDRIARTLHLLRFACSAGRP